MSEQGSFIVITVFYKLPQFLEGFSSHFQYLLCTRLIKPLIWSLLEVNEFFFYFWAKVSNHHAV